jgi:hypothetical protein
MGGGNGGGGPTTATPDGDGEMPDWLKEFLHGGIAGGAANFAYSAAFSGQQGRGEEERGYMGSQAAKGEFALPGESVSDFKKLSPIGLMQFSQNPVSRTAGAVGRDALQIGGMFGGEAEKGVATDLNAMLQRQVESMDLKTLLTDPLAPIKTLGLNIKDLIFNVDDWAESLKESQRAIAKYNGELAAAFTRSEIRTIRRQIGSAANTGQSTAALIKSLDDLKDTAKPYQDFAKNGFNMLIAGLTQGVVLAAGILEAVTPIDEIVKGINKLAGGKSGDFLSNEYQREFHNKFLYSDSAKPFKPRKTQ